MIVSSFFFLFIDTNNSELAPELQPTVSNIDLECLLNPNLIFLFCSGGGTMGDLGPGMLDPGGSLAPRDEIKTQFMTREGTYQVKSNKNRVKEWFLSLREMNSCESERTPEW